MILGEVYDLFARRRGHIFLHTAGVPELLLRSVCLSQVRKNGEQIVFWIEQAPMDVAAFEECG
jgi:hypothetical protein